jgi:hypothetical protein
MNSMTILSLLLCSIGFFLHSSATPLDDYVWKFDENYKWVDMVRRNFFIQFTNLF